MDAGNLLATFLNTNFTSALSLSFVSHSLGARVVLQTIAGLNRPRAPAAPHGRRHRQHLPLQRVRNRTPRCGTISVLASRSDNVLKWAFPAGNFVSGLFSRGAPYIHEAIGREGPSTAITPPNNVHADWQIPDDLELRSRQLPAIQPTPNPVRAPAVFPPPDMPEPPAFAPPALAGDASLWQPGFSAAIQTSRWP